jgi:putative cell wall-binding protein
MLVRRTVRQTRPGRSVHPSAAFAPVPQRLLWSARRRPPVVLAAVVGLVLALLVPILPVGGAPVVRAAEPKVVIIVGATEGTTSTYRQYADVEYAEAIKYTSNVVKVYSPNATWSAVAAAVKGASIVIYHGHGNGWPSPYPYDPTFKTRDGFGLNATAGQGDYNLKYYGEPYVETLQLAPNAVVLLHNLCYASGNSEPGYPEPSLDVARQRVDNYASAFIRAGAAAVIADGHMGASYYIRALFTTRQSIEAIWRNAPNFHGNVYAFDSVRSPGRTNLLDPEQPTSRFYRSVTGRLEVTADQVTGAPFAATDVDPPTFVVPGAASTARDGAPVYPDAARSQAPVASLAAGTPVRLTADVSGTGDATAGGSTFSVRTLDGSVEGYMAGDDLVPRDSTSPAIWVNEAGPATSGYRIAGAISETATWTVELRSPDGSRVLRTASGTGASFSLSWDGLVDGAKAPDGLYPYRIAATDAWANPTTVTTGTLVVSSLVVTRLGGADRYGTAAAVAATYPAGVPVAYVASGLGFADALAGAPAAARDGGPLLLVRPDAIPAATATELARLRPSRIVVLGGPASVSEAVARALQGYTTGSVTRLGGADRYGTAAAVAATYPAGVPVAYVASGLGFADALAGAPAAARDGGPLLLVRPDAIPAATATELARLRPSRIVVLGGPASVSEAVARALQGYTTGSVTRLGGADRYGTAAAVAATYPAGVPVAYVASGLGFADALAGAPAAARDGGPLLLVRPDAIPAATATELARLRPSRIVVLGGPASVSEAVARALQVVLLD